MKGYILLASAAVGTVAAAGLIHSVWRALVNGSEVSSWNEENSVEITEIEDTKEEGRIALRRWKLDKWSRDKDWAPRKEEVEEFQEEFAEGAHSMRSLAKGAGLRRDRRYKRRKASKAVAQHLRSKFGLMKDNPANRQILGREARIFCKDEHVRKCDIDYVVPFAIEYALTPHGADLEAADYKRSLAVRLTKWWAAPEN